MACSSSLRALLPEDVFPSPDDFDGASFLVLWSQPVLGLSVLAVDASLLELDVGLSFLGNSFLPSQKGDDESGML